LIENKKFNNIIIIYVINWLGTAHPWSPSSVAKLQLVFPSPLQEVEEVFYTKIKKEIK